MKNLIILVAAIVVLAVSNINIYAQGKSLALNLEGKEEVATGYQFASEPATIVAENIYYCNTAKNQGPLHLQIIIRNDSSYYRINDAKRVTFITRQCEKNQKSESFIAEFGKNYVEVNVNEVRRMMSDAVVDHISFNANNKNGQYFFNPQFNSPF